MVSLSIILILWTLCQHKCRRGDLHWCQIPKMHAAWHKKVQCIRWYWNHMHGWCNKAHCGLHGPFFWPLGCVATSIYLLSLSCRDIKAQDLKKMPWVQAWVMKWVWHAQSDWSNTSDFEEQLTKWQKKKSQKKWLMSKTKKQQPKGTTSKKPKETTLNKPKGTTSTSKKPGTKKPKKPNDKWEFSVWKLLQALKPVKPKPDAMQEKKSCGLCAGWSLHCCMRCPSYIDTLGILTMIMRWWWSLAPKAVHHQLDELPHRRNWAANISRVLNRWISVKTREP